VGLEDKVAKFEAEATERNAAEKKRLDDLAAKRAAREAQQGEDQIAIQALGVKFARLATERGIASRRLRDAIPPVEGWVFKTMSYRMIMVTLAGEVTGFPWTGPSTEHLPVELPSDLTASQMEDIMAKALTDPSRFQ
jgi:hypothetical protein